VELPPALTDRVAHVLRRALARADERDAAALAEIDLPARQYGVLALLQAGPVARQHELGAALGLDRTTTATLLRRLEDRGLVHRAPLPGNNRTLVLTLTAEGERLRAAGARRLEAAQEEFLAPLPPTDRDRLRASLDRLLEEGVR
jgi:DNA-binding MarR family transcriptional regulator